jgi:protein O-mannosyl-transferase
MDTNIQQRSAGQPIRVHSCSFVVKNLIGSFTKRPSLLISLGLVFVVAIAFEPVRHNQFVEFDDNQYLLENTHIRDGFSTASVGWAFTSGYASNWHPLTWLSHMLDLEWFQLRPLGHHLHNLSLHALATVLLFLILQNMTGARWRSAFVALLFGIHPLHVESVAWAAERKDVLSGVFWMLTIAAYVHYVRRGGVWRYLLVMFCLALGLMAKPMLVSLPLVLLVLDFWPLKRVPGVRCQVSGLRGQVPGADPGVVPEASGSDLPLLHAMEERAGVRRGSSQRASGARCEVSVCRLVAEKIPLFILVAVSCVVTFLVQQHGKSVALDLPFAIRLSNALNSCIAYLGKLIWPANLAVLYPYPTQWPLWKPVAAAVVLAVISVAAIRRRSRQPWFAAGWFWYLIALIPVIGLVQVGAQSMADRYTYLPSIGIFILIAWGAAALSLEWRYRKEILALSTAVAAVAMTLITRAQVNCWKDSITLFEHAVAVTQNNYTMHHSLGWALSKSNRLDEAIVHLDRSLQLRPDPETQLDMADVLIKRKQFTDALIHLRKVLNAQPTNAIAHYNLGIIAQAEGKPDEAISAYEAAVRLDPNHAGAFNNLGIVQASQGLIPEATGSFRQSLRLAPGKASTHRNLAMVLQVQERFGEAVEHYRAALQLEPNDAETSSSLAYALHAAGDLREAIRYDRYTLQLNPDHVRALNDLAWILATSTDDKIQNPEEAIARAQKASDLTGFKQPDILDTLAAAYASARRFDAAVQAAHTALQLAKAAGQEDLAREIESRMQLYQSSTPYLEPPHAPVATQ